MSDRTPSMTTHPGEHDFRDVSTAHAPFRTGRLVLWIAIIFVVADFAFIVAKNENFGWPVVAQYLFDPVVMSGLSVSLGLTVIGMILGIAFGLIIAIARMSSDRLASSFASLFIWFFRGTPLLVQLIFWYNMSTLFPQLSIAVPFGPTLISWDTNSVITPMTAAIVGLALNEAAYMAEIIRGGLLSVDRGQAETAQAFGMTRARALWRIIIPQAMRSIVPPTGNQLISMIKATSLVSVIAMADLLYSVQSIYNRTFEIIPMLLVAVIWYLVITTVLNIGQSYIEAYYGRSDRRNSGAAPKTVALTEEASH
ncbi:amino acid ABC transporter permease [Oryzifoliimicrobium ureilyticus]|uniref:amino acid ABC transporter permease n=1 Tax=Oryzifoliimicrobium ureilyticus TaxID=3113724 RepID=UPI0030768181